MSDRFSESCPLPQSTDTECITLAYGEGGRLSRKFVQEHILRRFKNSILSALGDSAAIPITGPLAFTTDSYTVSPLFFPGGDIGSLAVCGAVNDLAVSGAFPRCLGLSIIIEEGLPWAVLDRVLDSIQSAAQEAGVDIVTGDTKVVPCGAVDQLFITTSGLGEIGLCPPTGPMTLQSGDIIIVSGPIGQHGAAVLCERDKLGFEPAPQSDCGNLSPPLWELQQRKLNPRALRDATRGGVAAVLHEWAAASGLAIDIDEQSIPVTNEVRAVCELLGLDPMFLACEGTLVAAVPESLVDPMISVLQQHAVSQQAKPIGQVTQKRLVPVCVRRATGRLVPLDEPAGSPLPRIC